MTFDLLDMPTVPGVLQSQYIHTCHTNGLIIIITIISHLKGMRMVSVSEDLTICDCLHITDS